MLVKDFRGLVIGVGDLLAYPTRRGSHMWMNYMTVEQVYPSGEIAGINDCGRKVKILRSDRVAVLGRN